MNQNFNDYDSIGQRPPIPGEETAKKFKVAVDFHPLLSVKLTKFCENFLSHIH